jgi:hypothetical protein
MQRTVTNLPTFSEAANAAQTDVRPNVQPAIQNFLAAQQLTDARNHQQLADTIAQAQSRIEQLKADPEIAQMQAHTNALNAQADLATRKAPSLPSTALSGFLSPEQTKGLPEQLPQESFDTLVKLGESKNRMDQAKSDKQENKDEDKIIKLGETLSFATRPNSPAKLAEVSLNNINRANQLIDQVKLQPGGPDARQTYELSLAQVRALIGAQQISEKEVAALLPSTFKGNVLQYLEKLKNEPIGLDQLKFMDRLQDTMNREKRVNQEIVDKFRTEIATTYGDVIQRKQDRAGQILQLHGLDINNFLPGKKGSTGGDVEAKKAALRAKLGI